MCPHGAAWAVPDSPSWATDPQSAGVFFPCKRPCGGGRLQLTLPKDKMPLSFNIFKMIKNGGRVLHTL